MRVLVVAVVVKDDPWLDVFVRDRARHRTIVVSRSRSGRAANGSLDAQIAAGGRYVVFSSGSSSIVRRDTNDDADVSSPTCVPARSGA